MEFDARFGVLVGKELSVQYAQVADQIEEEYLKLRAGLADHFRDNIDWWVSGASIRSNFESPLFHYCVILKLVLESHCRGRPIKKVFVDSISLGRAFRSLSEHWNLNLTVKLISNQKRPHLKRIRGALGPFRSAIKLLLQQVVIQRKPEHYSKPPRGALTLIDTFLLPGVLEKDRYYPGLIECLSPQEVKEIYFVPTFHNFGLLRLATFVGRLRSGNKKYLFKEDYLKLADVCRALAYYVRVRRLDFPKIVWCGIDVSDLWSREAQSSRCFESAVIGLINHAFFSALKKRGVKVRCCLDWFENQSLDVGWNWGARQFFPEALTVGYQGFYSASQGASPVWYEYEQGILPHSLAVMGPGLVEERKKHCPELAVQVAPAFRFAWLWDNKPKISSLDNPLIAAVLPADESTAKFVLDLVVRLQGSKNVSKVVVKLHPAQPLRGLLKNVEMLNNFKVSDMDLPALFQLAPIVVTGGITTAGLEAWAFGLPTIFCSPPGYRNQLPIPDFLSDCVEYSCTTIDELEMSIHSISERLADNPDCFRQSADSVRENLFSPIRIDASRRLLWPE